MDSDLVRRKNTRHLVLFLCAKSTAITTQFTLVSMVHYYCALWSSAGLCMHSTMCLHAKERFSISKVPHGTAAFPLSFNFSFVSIKIVFRFHNLCIVEIFKT